MTTVLSFLLIPWVFFTLILIGVIVILWTHETYYDDEYDDNLGWSHTIFIVLMCLFAYKFKYIWTDIKADPLLILKYFGSYILIGIIWAFIKWYSYLKNLSSKYETTKSIALSVLNETSSYIKASEEEKKKCLHEALYDRFRSEPSGKKIKIEKKNGAYTISVPTANNNKSLIISWISHWPISLVWTLINDPVKKLINYIFIHIKSIFQKISDHVFRDTIKDFK